MTMKTLTRNFLLFADFMLCSCSSEENEAMAQTMTQKMFITIGGVTKTATMVDNAATQELVKDYSRHPSR